MSADRVAGAQAWLSTCETELLENLRGLLRIPSLEADALPNAPFGLECRRALDYCLELCKTKGMTTKDIEGYCGWAEFGQGEKMILIQGHVDVVPVAEAGWKHQPFGAEIDGGYLYSRGAVDDKGPTMAALYAALAIREVEPNLNCRIRIVFGCNEESGFKCIHRYMETEEVPTFGIAPDAGWPLIHGEKGISDFIVDYKLPSGPLSLLEISGGQRPNIVIDRCVAKLRVDASIKAGVAEKVSECWDRNLEFAWDGDILTITARGKAAHGAWPHGGDNAAIRLFRFLTEISPVEQQKEYGELLEIPHNGGNGIGIAGADEPSGELTCNLGIIETKDGNIRFTLNVRYPVTFDSAENKRKCEAKLAGYSNCTLVSMSDSKPLYFPLEHPLVKAVCDAYVAETGDTTKPGTMGGGTYARAVPNSVAIGTGWPGDGPAHENDERLKVDHLHKMSRIYAHVLSNLVDQTQQ